MSALLKSDGNEAVSTGMSAPALSLRVAPRMERSISVFAIGTPFVKTKFLQH
jgi:hypothetical protein